MFDVGEIVILKLVQWTTVVTAAPLDAVADTMKKLFAGKYQIAQQVTFLQAKANV